jgi:hypothetical protein
MRLPIILSVVLLSIALLSGCHQPDQRPLNLITPHGYAKAQPIGSAPAESWEKKALLAMVAPTIAQSIEKADQAKAGLAAAKVKSAAVPLAKADASTQTKSVTASPVGHRAVSTRRLAATKHRRHRLASAKLRHRHALVADR